jgi:hypothetical protein
MEDYPRNVMELEKQFATDEACKAYLFRLRWPNGFVCPGCQAKGNWNTTRDRLTCCQCQHQTTVTAGTIFQDIHKPLTLWFRAAWYITSQKNGVSASSLQRELGLGNYSTAWTWFINSVERWFDRDATVYVEALKLMKPTGGARKRV